MKSIGWIFSCILLVIIVCMQMCPSKPKCIENDAIAAAFKKEKADIIAHYELILVADSAAIENATAHAVQQNDLLEHSKLELDNIKAQVKKLTAQLTAAKAEKPDDSWIPVSPRFISGCDSLRDKADQLAAQVGQYEDDNTKLVELMNYEVQVRDTALQHRDEFNASMKRQLDNCLIVARGLQNQSQRRTQVYAGVALWGNPINPFGGGEVNLSLKTKSDQMFEAKGAYILNGWWVGAGTKIKFHF